MKTVNILLWKYKPQKLWYRNIVGKCITFFTGYNVTHAAIGFSDGTKYESTVWKVDKCKYRGGAKKSTVGTSHDIMIPVRVTEVQENIMIVYLQGTVNKEMPYNFFKLVILAIVYPTRWFWNLIKWVPFDAELFGKVCSVYVDGAFKRAGKDLIKHEFEGFTVPGDFLQLEE